MRISQSSSRFSTQFPPFLVLGLALNTVRFIAQYSTRHSIKPTRSMASPGGNSNGGGAATEQRVKYPSSTSNPKVDRFHEIVHADPTDGWEKCWEERLTPWDLGQPTPVLVHLHR
ncbi:unnamed protein product, partial [Cuscuta epithymum]